MTGFRVQKGHIFGHLLCWPPLEFCDLFRKFCCAPLPANSLFLGASGRLRLLLLLLLLLVSGWLLASKHAWWVAAALPTQTSSDLFWRGLHPQGGMGLPAQCLCAAGVGWRSLRCLQFTACNLLRPHSEQAQGQPRFLFCANQGLSLKTAVFRSGKPHWTV